MKTKTSTLLAVATIGFATTPSAEITGHEPDLDYESKTATWTDKAIEPVHSIYQDEYRSSEVTAARVASLSFAENASSEIGQQVAASESTRDTGSLRRRMPREMEEIVVTAQKREELLKDVPISITVLEGAKLDSSTTEGVTEALARVAGVGTVNGMTTSGTFISVRGVSNGGALYSGANVVAYYVDSAPHGLVRTPVAPDSNAYDLEQVEVLRGPQGTLYGASALSGVVRVLTKRVNTHDFELKARASGSSTEGGDPNYRGDMAVNVPIVAGKLAARAVFGYQDLGGWIDRPNKKDANNAEIRNMRFKLAALPTDELSIELAAWLSRADYNAPNYSNSESRHTSLLREEPYATDFDSYSAKIDYTLTQFSITSTTSYLDYASLGTVDLVPQGAPVTLLTDLDARSFSQELLLNSNEKSSWRWTFGLFYRDGEDYTNPRIGGVHLGSGTNGSESYAVFGEIGRKFFHDKFGWTLGVRYFEDDVFISNIPIVPPGAAERAERSFHATTPRAVLAWYPNEDVTVYGTYSEGFRSGFDQGIGLLAQFPEFSAVEPDSLKNYEIGAKGNLLDGRLLLEGAVYFTDWSDLQQQLQVPALFNGVTTGVVAVVNSGSASGAGVDISATARPSDRLQLGVSFGWNDLTMDVPVTTLSTGVPVALFDKGDRLNQSPEYTVGGFVDYSVSLGTTGYEGQFSISANHTSRLENHQLPGGFFRDVVVAYGDEITLARVSFAVRAPSSWVATLFVDNVNDEDGAVAGNASVNPAWTARVRPRTVGLQFEYQY